jgi:hypothetical protein
LKKSWKNPPLLKKKKNRKLPILLISFKLKLMKKILLLGLLGWGLFSLSPVWAATETTSVTATIVAPSPSPSPLLIDQTPPTAPILVAPENNGFINIARPNFIFLKSTDESGIAKYQIFLDGTLLIDNITSELGTITITAPKDLEEGQHSWYVKVFDKAGNYAFSSTWHFTIDLTPPFIIVTEIEETANLNFSSIDLTSIPYGTTVTTRSRRPAFFGRGEPGATIQINLQDKKSYQFKTTVGRDGQFALIPDQDLANDTYEVTLISFDQAGNTALLPTFKLIVQAPPRFVIPICWLIVLLLLLIIIILIYLYLHEKRKNRKADENQA